MTSVFASLALLAAAAPQFSLPVERTIPLDSAPVGAPAAFPDASRATGILVTLSSGRVVLLSPKGDKLAEMRLDLRPTAPAIAVDLTGDGAPEIAVADVAGSIYAFDARGRRLWKYARSGKAVDYKALVAAGPLLFLSDSRGHLFGVDRAGHLRFQVNATTYRLSAPAAGDFDGDGVLDLVFGTEDREVYAVNLAGRTLWRTPLEGRFGRTLPRLADIDRDGQPEVFISTPFVGARPGVYALDARTGKLRWQARTTLQSYHSHVIADLDGDGRNELLYGDKNTRLYCASSRGEPLWNTQLGGRGIFESPALADLDGTGKLTIFQTVRDSGAPDGHSLYALDASGKVIASAPLPGGGLTSPVVIRFAGEDRALRVVQADARSALVIFRPPQGSNAKLVHSAPLRSLAAMPGSAVVEIALRRDGQPETRAELPPPAPVRVRVVANPWVAGGETHDGPVRVAMLGGEVESAAIELHNPGAAPADYRVTVGPELASAIRLHELPLVRPDSTGQRTEDLLPRLNEAGTIHLGAGETRRVWLTVSSRNLAPGVIKSGIAIADVQSYDEPASVPVEVAVAKASLPARRVFRHCNWLSLPAAADARLREAIVRDAVEHGTNVFIVPPASIAVDRDGRLGQPLTTAHDDAVRLFRRHDPAAFLLIAGSVGLQWPAGFQPDETLGVRAYESALRWYAGYVQTLGLRFEDFAFYLEDEPGLMGDDERFRNWGERVRRVKSADARLQVYANPAGGARAAMLAPFAKLVDIWQPDLHLYRDEPEALAAVFKQARHFWHYEAPADQRNLDPLGYYRAKPWVAFQLGMTGAGWWVYHYSALWQPDRTRAPEYGVVYMTPDGPVTTKRWEAARDGAEDFELLSMLREQATRAGDRAALDTIAEAVAFVTAGQDEASDIGRQLRPYRPDFARWTELRGRLIAHAERLAKP